MVTQTSTAGCLKLKHTYPSIHSQCTFTLALITPELEASLAAPLLTPTIYVHDL